MWTTYERVRRVVLPYLVLLTALAFVGFCEGLTGGPTP